MHLPEMSQFLDLQQTSDGHQHNRREHGLRQIAQQFTEKDGDECDENRAQQSGAACARAAAFLLRAIATCPR